MSRCEPAGNGYADETRNETGDDLQKSNSTRDDSSAMVSKIPQVNEIGTTRIQRRTIITTIRNGFGAKCRAAFS